MPYWLQWSRLLTKIAAASFALLLVFTASSSFAQKRGSSASHSHRHSGNLKNLPKDTSPIPAPPVVDSPKPAPESSFQPRVSHRAIEYQRSSRLLGISARFWSFLGLYLFLCTGVASRLQASVRWVLSSRSNFTISSLPPTLLQILAYMLGMTLVLWVWRLPFDIIGLWHEKQYGFGTQTMPGYLKDTFLSILFQMPAALFYRAGYELVHRMPERWWVPTWLVGTATLIFVFIIQPVVLAPRFNSYHPLAESPLKSSLRSLAAKAGIPRALILVENTSIRNTHVNAYVTGVGPFARIVINDTALKVLPEDQLVAMVGHEIGHYTQHHSILLLISSVSGLGFFLWVLNLFMQSEWFIYRWGIKSHMDLTILPAISLLASLFLFVQSPVENGISRTLERRADIVGLQLVNSPESTARLMAGFAERDLADPDPPALLQFWFGSHPTLKERIHTAIEYRDNMQANGSVR
jgi:STE24 endopeptidase